MGYWIIWGVIVFFMVIVIVVTRERKEAPQEEVSCRVCKCLGYKKDFHTVSIYGCFLDESSPEYYCQNDKPDYDIQRFYGLTTRFYKIIPSHEEEVKVKN